VTRQPKPGDRVAILKGARVFSTTPGWPLGGKTSSRKQVVTVDSVEPEHLTFHAGREVTILERVRWKGAGGYWRWTDVKNTEQINTAEGGEGRGEEWN